jgi:Tfp pilus assembly protein PilF
MTHYQDAVALLSPGDDKKKALYLATKLAYALEDYEKAEEYGLQLATIDFSYKDLGELLDKVSQKRNN